MLQYFTATPCVLLLLLLLQLCDWRLAFSLAYKYLVEECFKTPIDLDVSNIKVFSSDTCTR